MPGEGREVFGSEGNQVGDGDGGKMCCCKACGQMVDFYKMDRHMRTHTGERPYLCSQCPRTFSRADVLRVHLRRHTGELPYRCAQCDARFARADALRLHERRECGDTAGAIQLDATHGEIHMTEQSPETRELSPPLSPQDLRESSPPSVNIINDTPTNERDENFIKEGTKKDSIILEGDEEVCVRDEEIPVDDDGIHMGDERRMRKPRSEYECLTCGRMFSLACRLSMHEKVHHTKREYECAKCGKRFALTYQLQLHMRVHTGERPYVCKHCGKAFARAHNLTQHEQIHAGVKPHQCRVCQRSFSQPKTLTEHSRIHTGEKPFQCAQCLKLFVRYDNLKAHMVTHADNKRHTCATCGKKYSDLRCFLRHVAGHDTAGGAIYGATKTKTAFSNIFTSGQKISVAHPKNGAAVIAISATTGLINGAAVSRISLNGANAIVDGLGPWAVCSKVGANGRKIVSTGSKTGNSCLKTGANGLKTGANGLKTDVNGPETGTDNLINDTASCNIGSIIDEGLDCDACRQRFSSHGALSAHWLTHNPAKKQPVHTLTSFSATEMRCMKASAVKEQLSANDIISEPARIFDRTADYSLESNQTYDAAHFIVESSRASDTADFLTEPVRTLDTAESERVIICGGCGGEYFRIEGAGEDGIDGPPEEHCVVIDDDTGTKLIYRKSCDCVVEPTNEILTIASEEEAVIRVETGEGNEISVVEGEEEMGTEDFAEVYEAYDVVKHEYVECVELSEAG